MSGRLEGWHVLVTGGARGIGEAIVEKSLREGARVSFLDVEVATAEALVARLDVGERLLSGRPTFVAPRTSAAQWRTRAPRSARSPGWSTMPAAIPTPIPSR